MQKTGSPKQYHSGPEVIRFRFDPLEHLGGSLRQSQATSGECQEQVPPQANETPQAYAERLCAEPAIASLPS